MRRIMKYAAILIALGLIFSLVFFSQVQAAVGPISILRGGSILNVSSTGFAASATVTVTYDGTAVASTACDTSGNWSTSFTLPGAIAGSTHTVVATDNAAPPNTQTATFTMSPSITLSPTNGTTGNSVTVTGIGFAASATVNITFGTIPVSSTGMSTVIGNLTQSFIVPAATTNVYTVTVLDSAGNQATATFNFTATPTITINKTSGSFGTSVTVNGTGFNANETGIQVTFTGVQVGQTTQANSIGTWSNTFTVPTMPGGSYTVGAFGSTTNAASVATLTFNITPTFTLNKTSSPTGAAITANGTGFAANEANINVTWDATAVALPIKADANGSWTLSFNVPSAASGPHTVGVSGSTTAASSITAIQFTVGAGISVNRTSGTMGTSVTVTGSGFGAGETGITILFDDIPMGTPTSASATGNWSTTFTVPASSGGGHRIDAKGSVTAAASIQELSFITLPTVSLNKTGATAGTSVIISGTGFGANENNITVTYDNIQVSTGITADNTGSWSATFTVPASSAGTHTIKVNGPVTQTSVGSTSFKISSSISVNPTTGNVGSSVTVTGSGFASNSPLSISYDENVIPAAQVSADASGNFSKSITIPKSLAGSHTIKVSDNASNVSSASFNMDSTPPPVPNPIFPTDGSKIGLTGNIKPDLKWSAVSDPSGISYTLQIDTDPDFTHPVIEKTELVGTHYILTQTEALPKGQYYWRVRAVDGASNQSAWSPPFALSSGIIASSTLILLIVVVIVALAVIVYILLIRPALKKRKVAVPAGAPAQSPEIVIPEVVSAEYRTVESEDATRKRALPWRLALPQAPQQPKGAKTLSPEDQARLKAVIDFAKSLPLVECGSNTAWLVDLAENITGSQASPLLYSQILRGEIQLRYDPAWMRHPTFRDLQDLLEGQAVLQDLNSYVDSINRTAVDAVQLLQDVYKDATAEITWDILANSGWSFVSAVYDDAVSWYLGKNLREPSDRDYTIKQEADAGEGVSGFGLYGAQNTAFAGLLVKAPGEKEASQMRTLHLKLRRVYRNSDKARDVVSLLTQLDVQRNKVLNALSQFNRLNP